MAAPWSEQIVSQKRRNGRGPARMSAAAVTAVIPSGVDIAAGQVETLTGNYTGGSTVEAGGTLIVGTGAPLCLFGPLSGGGSVVIGAGATLFVAGSAASGLDLSFAGPASTLELSGLYVGAMFASISGLAAGVEIDLVDTSVTSASLVAASGTTSVLQLRQDGTVLGTLALLSSAQAGAQAGAQASLAACAVPDLTDGTRIVFGPAMPPSTPASVAGSGASMTWQGGGAGQWNTPADWSTDAVPGSLDSVSVIAAASSVTSLAGDGSAATARFAGVVALGGVFTFGTLIAGQSAQDVLAIGAGDVVQAGTVTVQAGAVQLAGAGGALDAGSVLVGAARLAVDDSAVLAAGTLSLQGGELRIDRTGGVSVGTISSEAGTLAIGTGSTLSGFGTLRAPLLTNGCIAVAGGALGVFGAIRGAGSAEVAAGAILFASAGASLAGGITLAPGAGAAGGGELELFGGAASCTTVIMGMGPTTSIDIASCALTQAAWTPPSAEQGGIGVLDLGAAGTLDLELSTGLDPRQASFALASDGVGGTRISLIPCFRTGTLIATDEGPRPVESLRLGQRLVTLSGGVRPVRWLGRRAYTAAAVREQPQLRPVRIRAGSLPGELPARDVWLSPRHGVVLDTPGGRRIVPAVALVDGMRAERCGADEPVTYVHVGLDVHDTILAEQLPVETYRPHAAGAESLFHAEWGRRMGGASRPCWPELECGSALEAARGFRLPPPRRAGAALGNLERVVLSRQGWRAQGWACGRADTTTPATIRFYLEGVPCGLAVANQWRPDLDNAGLGACGFDGALPPLPAGGRLAAVATW